MSRRIAAAGCVLLLLGCLAVEPFAAPLTSAESQNRERWRLELLLTRARLQLDAGYVSAALDSCLRAQQTGLWDARLESLFGEVYIRQEKWADAVMSLRRATGSKRDKQMLAQAATELGWERRDTGALDDAMRLWQEAVKADPTNAWAHSSLGLGYLAQRQLKKAYNEARLATELEAGWDGAWSNLGLVLYVSGDPVAAETALLRALAISPDDPLILNNLAFAKFERDQTEEALGIWEKLAETAPPSADRLAGLAIGYLATGERDKALAAYKQAVAADGSYLKPDVLSSRRFWSEKAVKAACELIGAITSP